jgi:hypothetical protein
MKLQISIMLAIFTLVVQSQSLQYKMENFEKAYNGKDNKKDSIFLMQISYPVFFGDSSVMPVANKINKSIQESIFGEAAGGSEELFEGFRQIVQDDEDSSYFSGFWTFTTTVNHVFTKDNVISFYLFHDEYLGGAHPNSYGSGLNYNTLTGEMIADTDIFIPGYRDELNKLGEQIVRKEREIPESQTLSDYGYWFENDKFLMNNNFIIKEEGLFYTFVPYEIGPYVMGYTEIMFPYEKIKNLISPTGVLAWAIKK